MIDARCDNHPYNGETLYVYLPGRENENLLVIEEGTGDNLLKEDINEGYKDYVNYGTHTLTLQSEGCEEVSAEFNYVDGGMVLFRALVKELNIGQIVNAVLEDFLYPYDAILLD